VAPSKVHFLPNCLALGIHPFFAWWVTVRRFSPVRRATSALSILTLSSMGRRLVAVDPPEEKSARFASLCSARSILSFPMLEQRPALHEGHGFDLQGASAV
jgi:hypothetical protein